MKKPKKPNGYFENPPKPKKTDIDKEIEVILYAIVITEKARIPCWNYTKRVLEDYKSKKIRTFNQLLVYLDKTEKSKNNNYTNRTHYSFMDDMHSKEEWEALYDN